jgi:hypothetical protein
MEWEGVIIASSYFIKVKIKRILKDYMGWNKGNFKI